MANEDEIYLVAEAEEAEEEYVQYDIATMDHGPFMVGCLKK
jgi:hypothetical protein